MSKTAISQYSATPSSNSDVDGIDISEGCPASNLNNAQRSLMSHLKEMDDGTSALTSPSMGQLNVDNLRLDGNTISSTDTNGDISLSPNGTGSVNLTDNDKLTFGTGSDLQIYHDGNRSWINDSGTGDLRLITNGAELAILSGTTSSNEYMIQATKDGAVTMYYDAAAKIATTSSGVDVTGGLTTLGTVSTTSRDAAIVDYSGSISRFVAGRAGGNYGQWEAHVAGASGITKRYQIDYDSSFHWFAADGTTERMTIDSSGTTKIGFNNANSYWELIPQSGGAYAVMDHASSAGSGYSYYVFRYNGTTIGGISQNGTSGINYVTSSDYRLKTAVTYDWDATTRLKQLKPARFEWIADGDNAVPVDGFLAHEAQAVVPESVTGTKDEVEVWKDGEELPDGVSVGDNKLDDDGNTIPVMQGIDQSKLVPLLVKTIIELEARITALEAE